MNTKNSKTVRYLGLQLGLVKSSAFNLRDLASNASDNLKKFYDKSLDYGGQLTEQIKKRLPADFGSLLDTKAGQLTARALFGGLLGGSAHMLTSQGTKNETKEDKKKRLIRSALTGALAGGLIRTLPVIYK